jgi:hypothetical protein
MSGSVVVSICLQIPTIVTREISNFLWGFLLRASLCAYAFLSLCRMDTATKAVNAAYIVSVCLPLLSRPP